MRARRTGAASGFTLFEVLTALAILAGAFVGIFAVFRAASGVAESARVQGTARETARVVRALLARDLGSVYLPGREDRGAMTGLRFLIPGPSGSESSTDTGDLVVLDLYTLSRLDFDRDEPAPGLTRVRWLLRPRTDGGQGYDLIRAELDDPQLLSASVTRLPWVEALLARDVAAFSLSALDERQAGRDNWDSQARERQGYAGLPRLVAATYAPRPDADDRRPAGGDGPAGSFTARLALPFQAVTAGGVQ